MFDVFVVSGVFAIHMFLFPQARGSAMSVGSFLGPESLLQRSRIFNKPHHRPFGLSKRVCRQDHHYRRLILVRAKAFDFERGIGEHAQGVFPLVACESEKIIRINNIFHAFGIAYSSQREL